jgi:hypothetical protein
MNRKSLSRGSQKWIAVLPLFVLALLVFGLPSTLRAQVTATVTGTVEDQSGGVIPGAQVTLTNESTKFASVETSNGVGLYAFPSLTPGTYDIKASAKGFKASEVTGVVLNAGDVRAVPALQLTVGAESQTVTISASEEMIPVENGAHVDVLSSADIDNLALTGRDTTELLKVLPGTVTTSGGLTQTSPTFSDLNITVDEGGEGNGFYTNGSIYRGGTSILVDGAETIDIGNMAGSLVIISPEMTSQVSMQSSNMSADQPFGPLVISTISRSGSANYHGEGYFNARNNVLNANGWQQNNTKTALGPQSYYYPGGSFGGPVPGTHKHLLFWGGYEKWLQNQGNANVLTSYIPTPEMMAGDFSTDNADNTAVCPNGFFQGATPGGYAGSQWCSDLGGAVFANTVNGTYTSALPTPAQTGVYPTGCTVGTSGCFVTDAGQKMPAGTLIDPGAAVLAKIWPKANHAPTASVCNGCNYYQPIVNIDNGWIYRVRADYLLGDNTKIYGSYEQAFSSGFAQGNGAHLYWTPGNAIPFPGGGEVENNYGKVMAGHIVHTFNATTTNDFLAAWAFGSYPFTTPNPSAAFRTTLGYNYGKVFSSSSANIPSYNSNGNIPDFSQASIFENPVGHYEVKKEAPQFGDTLTKVWGAHTIKIGGFTQTTDNVQSSFSYQETGLMSFSAGQHPDLIGTTSTGAPVTSATSVGASFNGVANFVNGLMSGYSENAGAPIGDVAQQSTAGFIDDTWKTSRRLTLELGMRLEHVGHWYDRDHIGLAVFYPDRVLTDYFDGKYAPGYYWHAIDAGVPLSGQPNRFLYPDARFGLSYDVFGTGNTVVRGGWGVYRYVTQVNTVANGQAQGTAAHVLGYGQPGSTELQMRNIVNQAYVACPSAIHAPPCGVQGGQLGLDAANYGQPMTQAYNLTIDQRLPWNSQLEVAYVGSSTSQLVTGGEDISGSTYGEFTNMNKTPIGALFLPDPITGKLSTNPQNVGQNPNGVATCTVNCFTATGNTLADYHPLGLAYGTNGTFELENNAYANYNGLQASWVKTTGRLTFNLNGSWSKALGTTMQQDPFRQAGNYGPTAQDRSLVFNSSYTYSSGTLHTGSALVNGLGGGWTISGISTWQQGGYIPAVGSVNFNFGAQYTGLPANAAAQGINTAIGDQTYFGTDAAISIRPVLTCNPTSGLSGSTQRLNGTCFTAPAIAGGTTVSKNGGFAYPYMHATPFFDNDLAVYRTFHIYEKQQVQLRVTASDWLNHSLMTFNSGTPTTVNYNVDYATKAITPHYNTANTGANAFGVMTVKSALPYARVIELDVKYSF